MGRCELGCRIPFPSPSYDSRSVLAVKGSLRRAKRAPLTAPGRSEAHNLYEGKGIRGTSHLSTISASAPQSAFHRSTVLKCGRLLARSWPVPPTRNPEEPTLLTRESSILKLHSRSQGPIVLKGYFCSNLGGTPTQLAAPSCEGRGMLSHRHPKTAPCVNRLSLLFAGCRNGDGAQGQVRAVLLDCDFDQSLLDRRFNQAGESRIVPKPARYGTSDVRQASSLTHARVQRY